MWNQVYDPLNSPVLSTIAAAVPVITLLVLIASGRVQAHIAAIVAVIVTNLITIQVFGMPTGMSIRASILGIVTGFFPIGWIVLNVIFLYQVTVTTGRFELLKRAVGGVTEDRRLQLLLIAFSFGAFFEGASGFGTPVAITGAVLIGLGFSPLAASGLSLIANTAPVAYGALGTPIAGLASVTGLAYSGLTINLRNKNGKDQPPGDLGTPMANDPRVREALELSIDRGALNQVVFNGEFAAGNQWVAPGNPYYLKEMPITRRDVAKAKDLLAAAGVPNPVVAMMAPNTPEVLQVAQVVQALLPPKRQHLVELDFECLLRKHPLGPTAPTGQVFQEPARLAGQKDLTVGHVARGGVGNGCRPGQHFDDQSWQLKRAPSLAASDEEPTIMRTAIERRAMRHDCAMQ